MKSALGGLSTVPIWSRSSSGASATVVFVLNSGESRPSCGHAPDGDGLYRGAISRDESKPHLMQRHVMRSPGQRHVPIEVDLLALNRPIIHMNRHLCGLVRGVAAS